MLKSSEGLGAFPCSGGVTRILMCAVAVTLPVGLYRHLCPDQIHLLLPSGVEANKYVSSLSPEQYLVTVSETFESRITRLSLRLPRSAPPSTSPQTLLQEATRAYALLASPSRVNWYSHIGLVPRLGFKDPGANTIVLPLHMYMSPPSFSVYSSSFKGIN